ncbi:MAG: class I SAM-dependent methyltransferase [Desulfobacterales bacterium]|nr:class I SAM-dependent methyltransferase [Desulfobacterales bacterium]
MGENLIATPPTPVRRGSLKQRLFAWMAAHCCGGYDLASTARKQSLFGGLHGDILEIGPGSGPNLRFFPADVRWVGVEPNPYMHPYLQQAILKTGLPKDQFHIDPGDPHGVRLPAEDESIDAVVSTLVLCSVPHPQGSLGEILRVLKPGGSFMFIEHVAAPAGTRLRSLQDFIQPLWTLIGEGCHPNRETWQSISEAGFAHVEIEHYRYRGAGPVGPHIAGRAIKTG